MALARNAEDMDMSHGATLAEKTKKKDQIFPFLAARI
jgi:hypothetical protein